MKTSKHQPQTTPKPASISKHAKILGKLGGRPKSGGKTSFSQTMKINEKARTSA